MSIVLNGLEVTPIVLNKVNTHQDGNGWCV